MNKITFPLAKTSRDLPPETTSVRDAVLRALDMQSAQLSKEYEELEIRNGTQVRRQQVVDMMERNEVARKWVMENVK